MLSALSRRYARLVLLVAALAVALMSANAEAKSARRATTTDVTLTVTKNGTGSGTVSSNPTGIHCGSTCSYNFPLGTQVTLTATPAAGSSFQFWYSMGGGPNSPPPCIGGAATCTFTMNQAESIRATFNAVQESVSVSNAPQPGSSGTIAISGSGTQLTVGPGQQRQAFFTYGATVTVTPNAASGSAFTGWSGDCSGFGSCAIVANKSIFIQGSFAVGEKLQVRLTGKGAGTVMSTPAAISCPGTCAGLFGVDSEVTLTATPAPGSYFAGWPLSSGCDDSESTCMFQMALAESPFPFSRSRLESGTLSDVNLRERFQRWWKPADYYDDHPLSDEEREETPNPLIAENLNATYDEAPGAGGPGAVPRVDEDFRRP
jgi:hypothetical protein